jgi:hypothetical protein
MMKKPSKSNKVTKFCDKCGVKLTDFIAYIPGVGEACMRCFAEEAREKELKS